MEDDKGIKLEEQENGNCFGSGECFGCFDLQDKMKKANDKCANLEIDIGKKISIIERLECKVGFMELENIKFLDEVRKLKQRNEELEKSIRDSEEEQEKFTHLMIENEVLLCEKRKAESDLELWKLKCKEMEAQVMELEKKLATGTTKAVRDSQDMCSGKINHRGGSLSGFNVEGGQPSALRAATENEPNNGVPKTSYKWCVLVRAPQGKRNIGLDHMEDFVPAPKPPFDLINKIGHLPILVLKPTLIPILPDQPNSPDPKSFKEVLVSLTSSSSNERHEMMFDFLGFSRFHSDPLIDFVPHAVDFRTMEKRMFSCFLPPHTRIAPLFFGWDEDIPFEKVFACWQPVTNASPSCHSGFVRGRCRPQLCASFNVSPKMITFRLCALLIGLFSRKSPID